MATVKKTVTIGQLPNGATLFVEFNEVGGRRYWSDEIGGGVCVWDTSLVDSGTLLAAMAEERTWEFLNARSQKGYASDRIRDIPEKAKPIGRAPDPIEMIAEAHILRKAKAKTTGIKRPPGRPPGRPPNGQLAVRTTPIRAAEAIERASILRDVEDDIESRKEYQAVSQHITDDLVEELQELSEEDENELPPPPLEDYEIWEPRLKMFYRDKMWSPTWGARPGQEGCEAPPDLIEEVRTGRPQR